MPEEQKPVTTLPAKQTDLVAQYELGDTDNPPNYEEAPRSALPPAATPPVETPESVRPTPPKDPDTGRFVSQKQHSSRIKQMALDYGISDEEIEAASPEGLESTVFHIHKRVLQQHQDNERERLLVSVGDKNLQPLVTEPRSPQERQPAAEEDFTFSDTEIADYDPLIKKALKLIQTQAAKIKELEGLRGQVQQISRVQEDGVRRSFAAQADAGFSDLGKEYETIFGSGRGFDMDDADPNKERRIAVLTSLQRRPLKGGTLRAQVAKRAKELFMPAKGPEPEKKPVNGTPTASEWDEAVLTRPTHRGNAVEPKGMALAERNVAAQLRELATAEGQGEETSLDGFLE